MKIKWFRILVVLIIAGGLIFSQYTLKKPDPKESEANFVNEYHQKNIEIVETRSDLLLPDMKLLPPEDLYIQVKSGVKKIRFDTTFANIGDGKLELIGETDLENKKTIATQIIEKVDGTTEEMKVGEFVYHEGHKHWHVDKYALFELWKFNEQKEPTELVASTDKFSFCIWDEHTYDLNLPNAKKTRQYPRCPKNVQGNSVGWGDTYRSGLEGQEIDITNVSDGTYLVKSTVNSEYKILEKDYNNNSATLFIELKGNKLSVIK